MVSAQLGKAKAKLEKELKACTEPEFDSKPLKVGTLLGAVDN